MSALTRPKTLQIPSPFGIPDISDQLLAELGAKITPVVKSGNSLFWIKAVDPRKVAFTWDPKLVSEATNLEEVAMLRTLHSYGAPSLFKPSIAEVLAQIPAGYIDRVVAYRTYASPESVDEWSAAESVALNWGFHLAYTVLYRRS